MNRCLHARRGILLTSMFNKDTPKHETCVPCVGRVSTRHGRLKSALRHAILVGCGRCFTLSLAALCLTVSLLPVSVSAQGFVRQFPPTARRAMLEVTAPPNVLLNGQAERLSPGARIKGTNNQLLLSGALVGQPVLVNYVRNAQGQLHELWLLTPAEAAEKRAGMEPITNFTFGSDADKPKTDDGKTPFDQLPKFQQ